MFRTQTQVKLFCKNRMSYTPFDPNFIPEEYEYLKENGIQLTDSICEAQILLSTSLKKVIKNLKFQALGKPILIWTNEPRVSKSTKNIKSVMKIFGPVSFLNIYSNKVFINNVTYQRSRFQNKKPLEEVSYEKLKLRREVVGLMSFYNGTTGNNLRVRGQNLDLISPRNKIALYGYNLDLMKVYGKGWPNGMSLEDSRTGDWPNRKRQILSEYNFNLCFENSVYPYYVTEKIWDAIENHCLPIYYGGANSTIYDDFPENSFLDYSKYNSPEELFNKISNISSEEYTERINKCIDTYNKFVSKDDTFWNNTTEIRLNNIIETCRSMAGVI